MSDDLFPGFVARRLETEGCEIFARVGGDGPPMLLLHGYPQTHVMWHRLAPLLADRFTLVCADLRGYGDSGKPAGDAEHSAYSKRTMAADQVAVMAALGYARFAVVGHDRGGRVAHRMCLDHPDKITRAAVLDIVPTRTLFQTLNQGVALTYYHWLFLAQPFDLPERLIGADPDYYLERKMGALGGGLDFFDPRALAEYKRCFRDPATIHATCEDYRAAASIDLAHDEADLWTARSPVLCWSCGASRPGWSASTTCSPLGARRQATHGALASPPAITWPRRTPTRLRRRWRSFLLAGGRAGFETRPYEERFMPE